jgi:ParB/RepB/Spo0J family partition protein
MTGTIHQHPSTYSPDEAPRSEGWELRHVDPSGVLDNPDNARRPERDREGLAASIAALGILTPPLVRTTESGELVLIAGERRKYSAIAAGLATIPVYVRNDLSPVHQVAGMLVENIGRDDLTPVEEAVAIQQLAGFDGVTQKDITAMTGIKATKVRQALIVARSEVATEVAGRYDLTLDRPPWWPSSETTPRRSSYSPPLPSSSPSSGPTWRPASDRSARTGSGTKPWWPRSRQPGARWSSSRPGTGSPRAPVGWTSFPRSRTSRSPRPSIGTAPVTPPPSPSPTTTATRSPTSALIP